jgi:hypothetical protein
MEGKLVALTIKKIAERNSLSEDKILRILDKFKSVEEFFDAFGFCMSKDSDLLSQWRGYADDGHGVAIGFRSTYFESVSAENLFELQNVRYEISEHEYEIEPTFKKLLFHISNGAFDSTLSGALGGKDFYEATQIKINESYKNFKSELTNLFPKLYLLKSKAFKEELEWRLISYTHLNNTERQFYRATRSSLVPFREISLGKSVDAISEIVLGPKHRTPVSVVDKFLQDSNFLNVKVSCSQIPYR